MWDLTDNVTWTHGNHTFTFGGHYRYSNQHDVNTQPPIAENLGISSHRSRNKHVQYDIEIRVRSRYSTGVFRVDSRTDNNGEAAQDAEALYATLTGRVSSISGFLPLDTASKTYKSGGITSIKEKQAVGGFYIQDAWQVTPHFALNYGFRWQFSGPHREHGQLLFESDLGRSVRSFHRTIPAGRAERKSQSSTSAPPAAYNGDYKQPAPNLGFAWNPDFEDGILGKIAGGGNLVIRGGFAISHYDEGWIPWENVATGSISNQSVSLNPGQFPAGSISFDPSGASLPPLNSVPVNGFQLPLSEAALTFTSDGVFSTVDPKIRSPYIENWTLGVQRKLTGNWVVDVNYVGNHSVHMWEAYDLNEVNIFQNVNGLDSFLQDFQNAQLNYTASGGTTLQGPNPMPILTQAFGGSSSASFQSAVTNPELSL